MDVNFYTFSKRRNSTKQPTGAGTLKKCNLKENTSLHNPVLEIAGGINTSFDYAYISAWGRYYYVTDQISVANDLTQFHLEEDLLATHKTDIGNSKAYIVYASTGYDTMKIDSRIMTKNTKTKNGGGAPDTVIFNGGAYYLTVFNGANGGSSGISQTYQLNDKAMDKIRRWFGDTSIYAALANYFNGSPMDGVFSVKWMPFKYVAAGGNTAYVYIGDRDNVSDGYGIDTGQGEYASRIDDFPTIVKTVTFARPNRYSDFRMYEPYTTGIIYLPGVGNLSLNLGDWKGSNINVIVTIEVITGNVSYLLTTDAGAIVQTASCNVSSNCPIAKEVTNGSGVVSSLGMVAGGAAGLVGGLLSGGTTAVAASGAAIVAGMTNTVLNANQHAPSVSGNFGSRNVLQWPYITMIETSVDTEDPDAANYITEKGRPVGVVNTINSYSGYVQTIDAHVNCDAPASEKEEINSLLNSGIFYE